MMRLKLNFVVKNCTVQNITFQFTIIKLTILFFAITIMIIKIVTIIIHANNNHYVFLVFFKHKHYKWKNILARVQEVPILTIPFN